MRLRGRADEDDEDEEGEDLFGQNLQESVLDKPLSRADMPQRL